MAIDNSLIYTLDLIGTASFAFSGALRGLDRRPDLVGISMLAGATAVGGGLVRDVALQRPVAMIWQVDYLVVILAAALITYLFPRALSYRESFFKYFDAIGLGIFSAIGAGIAYDMGLSHGGIGWYHGINPLSVLFIAAITGAGGGVIRDVLLSRMPLVLYKDIYILAVAVGAAGMMLVRVMGAGPDVGFVTAMVITTSIRVLAIWFNWSLPRVRHAGGMQASAEDQK